MNYCIDIFKNEGLTEENYLKATLKQPSLFYTPASMSSNNTKGKLISLYSRIYIVFDSKIVIK